MFDKIFQHFRTNIIKLILYNIRFQTLKKHTMCYVIVLKPLVNPEGIHGIIISDAARRSGTSGTIDVNNTFLLEDNLQFKSRNTSKGISQQE